MDDGKVLIENASNDHLTDNKSAFSRTSPETDKPKII